MGLSNSKNSQAAVERTAILEHIYVSLKHKYLSWRVEIEKGTFFAVQDMACKSEHCAEASVDLVEVISLCDP